MLYIVLIILLAIILPLAEGFLSALWVKQNESELLASLNWTPEAIAEDELEPVKLNTETEDKSEVDTNQAAEFVSNLLEDNESGQIQSDEMDTPAKDLVEKTESFENETSDEIEVQQDPENIEPIASVSEVLEKESPEEPLDPSQAGFGDSGQLLQTLNEGGIKVDEAFEEMFSDNEPTVSPDLERRIEENEDLEDRLARFEQKEKETEKDEGISEEDILNEAIAENNWESDPSFHVESEEQQGQTELFSSMARELLGEDFDFDSLDERYSENQMPEPVEISEEYSNFPEKECVLEESVFDVFPNENQTEFTDFETKTFEPPATISAESIDDGVFQSFGGAKRIVDSSLLADLMIEQDVLPVFPKELIQDTLIESDDSEAAKQNSFVEESKPMFVRTKKTN